MAYDKFVTVNHNDRETILKKNNVLRDLINEGKPTIGTHVHTVWPGFAEVIGYSGTIDYVEFTS